MTGLDDDLQRMNRDELTAETKRLRQGIREHRDQAGTICAGIIRSSGVFSPSGSTRRSRFRPGQSSCAAACGTAKRWSASLPTRPCWTRSMTDPEAVIHPEAGTCGRALTAL